MSEDWTESDRNHFEFLVGEVINSKKVRPYQLILILRSILYGMDKLEDKTRDLFVSTRVFYYDKKRKKVKKPRQDGSDVGKTIKNKIEDESPIVEIKFPELKKNNKVIISTENLRKHRLDVNQELVSKETNETKTDLKVENNDHKVSRKDGEGNKPKDNRRKVHFSIKVDNDFPSVEPEDLIFEFNKQKRQLIIAQERIMVNNEIDEVISKRLSVLSDKMTNPLIKTNFTQMSEIMEKRIYDNKEMIEGINECLENNLGYIIEKEDDYIKKDFIFNDSFELKESMMDEQNLIGH